jgi:hypothetical protein
MNTAHRAWRPASDRQQLIAGGLFLAACLYLVPFVDRGWVPLDEGMMGQAAERVLNGQLPHVDYEEPYPGALSYFYAGVFRVAGIDVMHLRWTVYAAAVGGLGFLYVILRRMLPPITAALATSISLLWTYPNYVSSLPSWWVLLFALVCLWSLIRYMETDRLRFAMLAGVSAGLAFTVKQTGVYLFPPLVMSLMVCSKADANAGGPRRRVETAMRILIGLGGMAISILITRSSLGSGELLYLVSPIVASCGMFILWNRWRGEGEHVNWRAPSVAIACAAVPIVILLLPHIAAGRVGAFLNGVFVVPQQRLQFTSLGMRPVTQIVAAAAALMWIFWSPPALTPRDVKFVNVVRWIGGIALVLFALRSRVVYAFIWEGVYGTAALVPSIAAWLLLRNKVIEPTIRTLLFASSSMAAWLSLSQFPFAAPIYFCYVAPLFLVAGILTVKQASPVRRLSEAPTAAIVLLFAVLSMNRGFVWNVGWFHEVHHLDTPLDLPRAHLYVADYEAAVFRRLIPLVQQHLGDRGLVAGPDTPDVYFLSGQFSPSGRLFDFFSGAASTSEEQQLAEWTRADVIVLFHKHRFSPPLPESLVAKLRQQFPQGESIPPFEVRWR